MKVFTSYFYQVRYFEPYVIPMSTAVWDPKWYHNFKGHGHVFIDKNGVINGLRLNMLVPGAACDGECYGRENCSIKDPAACNFLKHYREQLDSIDFRKFIITLEAYSLRVLDKVKEDREPYAAILFHEAPTNPCSERVVVQQWFKDNGYPIEEFSTAHLL